MMASRAIGGRGYTGAANVIGARGGPPGGGASGHQSSFGGRGFNFVRHATNAAGIFGKVAGFAGAVTGNPALVAAGAAGGALHKIGTEYQASRKRPQEGLTATANKAAKAGIEKQ